MTNEEIYEFYKAIPRGERARKITDHFNSLSLDERRSYANYLYSLPDGKNEHQKFMDTALN